MRLFVIGVFVLALGACAGDPEPIVLTAADSTTEVRLDAGEQFEVRLESNASTGYRWEIAAETGPYAVELRTREYIEPDTDLVGAPGEEVFVFEAIGDAEILRLEYIRPFDEPVIPDKVVEFIIRVDDAPWPPDNTDTPSTTSVTAPIEVAELLSSAPSSATVIGNVVWDDNGARLCEALAESFPPQCGGAAVTIANPDALEVTLEQEQSVRWTNDRVQLSGTYDGESFTLDG